VNIARAVEHADFAPNMQNGLPVILDLATVRDAD
jgi:hypothetical protein